MITLSSTIWGEKRHISLLPDNQIIVFSLLLKYFGKIDNLWCPLGRILFEYILQLHPHQNAKCKFLGCVLLDYQTGLKDILVFCNNKLTSPGSYAM